MKKLVNSILTLIVLSIVVAACSGDSYQKRIDKEKKAIKNFLADNKISVRHTYPDDHFFAENEYFLEPGTGVYLRVIDPGDLTDTLDRKDKTLVAMRFDSVLLMVKGEYEFGNNLNESLPITFTYGDSRTYMSNNPKEFKYQIMSPAIVLPLQKQVGFGAEVSLIVPFRNGSTYQASGSYEPYFFPRMYFSFYKHEEGKDEGTKNETK